MGRWLVVTAIVAAIGALVLALVHGWPASTPVPAQEPTVTPWQVMQAYANDPQIKRLRMSDEELQLHRSRLQEELEELQEDPAPDPNEPPGLARMGRPMEWYEQSSGRAWDRIFLRGELEQTERELKRRTR